MFSNALTQVFFNDYSFFNCPLPKGEGEFDLTLTKYSLSPREREAEDSLND